MSSSTLSCLLSIDVAFAQWQPIIDTSIKDIQQIVDLTLQKVIGDDAQCEVSLVFTDDATVQNLNKEYREKDKPTNVLSFSQIKNIEQIENMPSPVMLGDVVLAWETVAWEAADQGKVLIHHMLHLIVHGVLHLLGFDHIDDEQAEKMEKLEINILHQLQIQNPYL